MPISGHPELAMLAEAVYFICYLFIGCLPNMDVRRHSSRHHVQHRLLHPWVKGQPRC